MLEIKKISEGSKLTLGLQGRLDTGSSPLLEAELERSLSNLTELIFDLSELEYTSSAGLRVLLAAQKVMNRQGKMIVRNPNEEITDIFEVTGIINILNVE